MSTESHILVAAIDFGTAYSGWAYSFTSDFQINPTKVHAKHWSGGDFMSPKTPTALLIQPDGNTLDAFGYDAEDRYAELAETGEHIDWYYFRRFKMKIYDNKDLSQNTLLQEEHGKCLPALKVFSCAIMYLKNDVLKPLQTMVEGGIKESEIKWIITVPAIWDDKAKQFMREAAILAGIDNRQLHLALEPEAASILCRHLPVQKLVDSDSKTLLTTLQAGSRYMILDAGGGTIDTTVHELRETGDLVELHCASGGEWGGISVDKAFIKFMRKILSDNVFEHFQKENTDDFLSFIRTFEVKKRKVSPKKNTDTIIRLPGTLIETYEKESGKTLNETLFSLRYAGSITLHDWYGELDVDINLVVDTADSNSKSLGELDIPEHFELDILFQKFLTGLVGEDVFDKFKNENTMDLVTIFSSFDSQKKRLYLEDETEITIRLPNSFDETFKTMTGKSLLFELASSRKEGNIMLNKDRLKISSGVMRSFFKDSTQKVVEYVKSVIEEKDIVGVNTLLMVGGYSESEMLQHAIRERFPNLKVTIPEEAGLAVVKGAVIFGHNMSIITQRISRYTYGIEMYSRFIEGIHPILKRTVIDGVDYCEHIFDSHVQVGEVISLNKQRTEREYVVSRGDEDKLTLTVHISTEDSPVYITDRGCRPLGELVVPISDTSVPPENRRFVVGLVFGGTELQVHAKEKRTGATVHATFNFLG
ncbi:hypothetical protein ACJMK2_031473 [Sinanodonta woodiana]|uniref:Heat shock 70 kDa protein 12A n=1 Tax=Sinanodonta woodiana TaxID=1069815 RepID=A0ABD3WYY2_SINWO